MVLWVCISSWNGVSTNVIGVLRFGIKLMVLKSTAVKLNSFELTQNHPLSKLVQNQITYLHRSDHSFYKKLENYQALHWGIFQWVNFYGKLQHIHIQLNIIIALLPKNVFPMWTWQNYITEPGCALSLDQSIKLSGKVPLVTFELLVKESPLDKAQNKDSHII